MSRRLLYLVALFALVVGVLSPVAAGAAQNDGPSPSVYDVVESTTGSYVVVMDESPLVVTEGQDNLNTRAAMSKGDAMVETHDDALDEAGVGAEAKVHSYTNALNGFSAVMSYGEALEVAALKNVLRVLPDEMRQTDTDESGEFLGLHVYGGAWQSGVVGEDVIVGVIDTGIWPEHPSFADDGSYSDLGLTFDESVYSACDFGNMAHNPDDAPFTCNDKLLGARQILPTYRALIGADPDEFDSARDDDGHGTHTAGTAAGNADVEASMYGEELGHITGIAPRARVMAYKALGNLGGFTSDLAAAIDQAVADGVHVINYSVGGGPSLTGADDIAFLFAATAGVHVATSAGNSGPGAETMGGPATVPWITSVGASTQQRVFGAKANLKGGPNVRGASVTLGTDGRLPLVDAEFAGGDLCVPGTLDASLVDGKIVLCRRGAIARADKSLAVAMAGGAGMIMYNNNDVDNLHTDTHHVPSIHIDYTPGIKVKDYIAAKSNPQASIVTGLHQHWKKAPTMAIFSSRGANPVAADLIKPDITAPGVSILAAASPFPDPGSYPGELFQAISGTSMSSPHIAGIYALIKQVHPDWTPAMAKSAIMTTSYQKVRDNDRVTRADPFAMGAGHVDPGVVYDHGSAFSPGLVYDAGLFEYAAFTCGADLGVFTPGSCDFLAGLGIPFDASDLNLPSIGIAELAGSQTVTRTITSVSDHTIKWKAKVKAPTGYDVTVNPKKITLAPGETATYEVTITNNGGGAVGDWSFGSLTWKGLGHKAYSPIAVRGALFNAPPEITGAGATGSASFDVQFGYTGDYTAAAHGLEAVIQTSDTISQDPDQTYPSPDDVVGVGIDRIDYVISGSAFVRWSLVIPGPDDVDLFLEDSAGNIVAASTNGGTDELIELVLPADDTYTMVVHGWSIPNDPLPYTLDFWDVSATPGGSLTIDSAPASATVGTSGTVDVSWTGATSGPYLGAVSHSDGAGIIGLTLVGVTP